MDIDTTDLARAQPRLVGNRADNVAGLGAVGVTDRHAIGHEVGASVALALLLIIARLIATSILSLRRLRTRVGTRGM